MKTQCNIRTFVKKLKYRSVKMKKEMNTKIAAHHFCYQWGWRLFCYCLGSQRPWTEHEFPSECSLEPQC